MGEKKKNSLRKQTEAKKRKTQGKRGVRVVAGSQIAFPTS